MKLRVTFFLALGSAAAFAQSGYVWDIRQNPVAQNSNLWSVNAPYGSYSFTGSGVNFSGSGMLISIQPVPAEDASTDQVMPNTSSSDYDVTSTLALKAGGGTYIHVLRASWTGVSSCFNGYSYTSVELVIPSSFTSPGAATLNINECVAGSMQAKGSTTITATDGMSLRTVIFGGTLYVYTANSIQAWEGTEGTDLSRSQSVLVYQGAVDAMTGYPGIGGHGMPSGSGITSVYIGHHDDVAPPAPPASSIASSIFPTSVSLRWHGTADDPIGTGVFSYNITRNGTLIASPITPEWVDNTVQASTAYSYTISAVDYHGNASAATTINVTTPPANAIDPRRTGIYPTGSYWGGGGEQIDTLTGNLNFSLPLVKPMAKTSWSVPIGLSYNSQNWRQDNGVNWNLGFDVGCGYGWQLQIGSVTPYYTALWSAPDHFVYSDASGAQYNLNVNTNGIWSSTQGIYVWLDTTVSPNKLHFRDGTFWLLGSVSGGTEQDAGTMYPTVLEEPNGTRILISYAPGASLPSTATNTSARITVVADMRAQWGNGWLTYQFWYNTDSPVPHLTSIDNLIGTSENYTFTYTASSFGPPFGTDPEFAGLSATHLASISMQAGNSYQFSWDSLGAGELTQVTFPFGGNLQWSYSSDPYNGSRSLRAVSGRAMASASNGQNAVSYAITRDNASSATVHSWMSLADASGVGSKTWSFNNSGAGWQLGLVLEFVEKPSLTSNSILQDDVYTWSQDPASNPYISAKTTTKDEGSSNQKSILTTQTLDQYGNVMQAKLYPFNNTTSPLRTYNNTYLNAAAYTSNFIFNRLVTTTLTTSAGTKTLVQNTYDSAGSTAVAGTTYTSSSPFYYGVWSSSGPAWVSYYNQPLLIDIPAPVPLASRGNLVESVTLAKTAWIGLYPSGDVAATAATDGQTATIAPAANTTAPGTITTQSYSETISYNPWLGITQTTGLNGETWSYAYDSIGRPSTATAPMGAVETFTYSNSGVTPVTQTKTGPDGVTTTTLDGFGRAILVARGNSGGVQGYTQTVYAPCACSPLGKLQKVSQPYAPGATQQYWTTYAYDGLGRTVSVTQPDGASTTTYSYLGNQTTVTDPAGNWKQMFTDEQGNLLTVIEPDPANPPNGTLTTSYTYDWMNHVSQASMTRGTVTQTRTFVYSDAGLLTSATNPENGTVSYTYNTDNTLYCRHDAKGQDTVYTYDTQKRVTMVQRYPNGKIQAEDHCQRVTYSYDYNPYDSQWNPPYQTVYNEGRLTAVAYGPVDQSGNSCIPGIQPTSYQEYYSYWEDGTLLQKGLRVFRGSNSNITEVDYSYDGAGRVITEKYPMATPFAQTGSSIGSVTFTTSYDSMGRPSSLKDSYYNWYWAQGAQYDYAGRVASLQYIAGAPGNTPAYTTEQFGYNSNGQTTSMGWSTPSSLGPTGTLTYSFSAAQDNGQITQMSDSISGETVTYQYDSLKRLTSASSSPMQGSMTQPWNQTYQFDGFGNMIARALNGTNTPIPVNAATNQLSNATYDLNGNMTSGAGATFTYDEANRIATSSEQSGGIEYYIYAPDNKRIYKLKADGTEEWTFYGIRGEKLGVFQWNANSGLVPIRSNVSFAGRSVIDNNFPVYQDRVGTNRASTARFYPYGDEITSTGNDHEKFATYTRDSYTGLDYADQRFYASTYGNFTSPDPSMDNVDYGNPASWNAYAYTMGDPINGNDPSGLVTCGNLDVTGGGTVSSFYNTSSNAGLLTEFVWAEGGALSANGGSQTAMAYSQATIAQAVENRLAVANGQVAVEGADGNIYWGNGGTFNGVTTLAASILGYGGNGTTLAQEIVRAAAGTSEVNSSGQLNDMSGITSTLSTELGDPTRALPGRVPVTLSDGSTDYVTPECDRAISAMQATNTILDGYTLNQPGSFVTSLKANGNSNPDPTRLYNLGSIGGTTFYGVGAYAYGQYSYPPVRRPPPRRPGRGPRPQ